MDKLKISKVIVVEGRYDKIKIDSIADALVITTEGFGIFKEKDKRALLSLMAKERGLIVLADSDSAGRIIRNHLYSFIPKDRIIDMYIPRVPGKEKRKEHRSKEGFIGVEGMDADLLRSLLAPHADGSDAAEGGAVANGEGGAGANGEGGGRALTKADLYEDGFVGGENSFKKRRALLCALGLPEEMSVAALVRAVNLLGGYSKYVECRDAIST